MSNTGDFFQQFIDASRGKTGIGSKVRAGKHGRPGVVRRKTQILFEKNDELLKRVGGSTADPTPVGKFGPKKQAAFIRRGGLTRKAFKKKKVVDAVLANGGMLR